MAADKGVKAYESNRKCQETLIHHVSSPEQVKG